MDIKVTGNLPILADIPTEESLNDFVERAFPELINVSDGVVYFSGHIEEEELEAVEEFLVKIFTIIDVSEPLRIKIKGEDGKHVGEYAIDDEGIVLRYFDGTSDMEPKTVYTVE